MARTGLRFVATATRDKAEAVGDVGRLSTQIAGWKLCGLLAWRKRPCVRVGSHHAAAAAESASQRSNTETGPRLLLLAGTSTPIQNPSPCMKLITARPSKLRRDLPPVEVRRSIRDPQPALGTQNGPGHSPAACPLPGPIEPCASAACTITATLRCREL